MLGFSGNWRSNSSSISFFIALWSLSILASTCFSPACSGGGQAHKGAEEGEKSRPGRHDARRRVGGRECEGSCMETGETGERLAEGIGLCFIPAFIDLFIHADRLVQGPSRLLRVRAFTCCSVPGCREQPCASALRASCTADANASPSAVRIHDVPRPRGPLAVPLSYIRHAQPQPCWDRAGGREGTQTAWMCLAPGFAAAGLHALACQSSSSPSAARTASGTALASFARPVVPCSRAARATTSDGQRTNLHSYFGSRIRRVGMGQGLGAAAALGWLAAVSLSVDARSVGKTAFSSVPLSR